MSLVDRALVRMLPAVPRPVVKRLSDRYIAGETLEEACRVVEELNARGRMATIDVLGEEITTPEEALALEEEYVRVFDTIREQGLDSNISVKPTGLGLKLDPQLCADHLAAIVGCAGRYDSFVRIDMEDASTTTDTLDVYRGLRDDGLDRVGVVLQARLRRTVDDVAALAPLRPNVRLCKGIYLESAEIAYRDFDSIRASFVQALEELLDAGCYVGIATHDEWLVEQGQRLTSARGLAPNEFEFQMLLGVRPAVGDELVRGGHRLRIYTPFGRDWYAYSLRRLQENPRLAGYIATDTVGRLIPGRNGAS